MDLGTSKNHTFLEGGFDLTPKGSFEHSHFLNIEHRLTILEFRKINFINQHSLIGVRYSII